MKSIWPKYRRDLQNTAQVPPTTLTQTQTPQSVTVPLSNKAKLLLIILIALASMLTYKRAGA
ncbi:MAG: hypothetical protein C6H99_00120 [Epsilonproteobacteria bacterium]|nr:hypothetical protein [Campylobacterota bacterium]NPA63982.1 hypothetical protein [Campylobacterota bacterium]